MPDLDAATELMLRFQGGDEDAYAELVHGFQKRIVSLAFRYVRSTADAEDVAQEVFLRVFRAKERYEPKARFSTWIHRITVNASLNHLRARKARKGFSAEMPAGPDGELAVQFEDAAAPEPGRRLDENEVAEVLRSIIDSLPERQKTAILLNKYQGLSYEETADAMELSVPAIKSLLTRARVNVKERLLPYWNAGSAPDL